VNQSWTARGTGRNDATAAIVLTRLSFPLGTRRMTTMPTTGRNIIRLRMWLLIKSKEDLLRSESF
jgi:hypothetical protein